MNWIGFGVTLAAKDHASEQLLKFSFSPTLSTAPKRSRHLPTLRGLTEPSESRAGASIHEEQASCKRRFGVSSTAGKTAADTKDNVGLRAETDLPLASLLSLLSLGP